MHRLLNKSLTKKKPVKLLTNHPDGISFDGVVFRLCKDLVIIFEIKDMQVDGVAAFTWSAISGVIDLPVKHEAKKLIKSASKQRNVKWLNKVNNVRDLVSYLRKREEWVALETVEDDDSMIIVGTIDKLSGKGFTISSKQLSEEKPIKTQYQNLFKIEIYSSYISFVRDFLNSS